MLKFYIADKKGSTVEINEDAGENTGLVVATRSHKTFTTKMMFATHPTYGREMAQNASYGGAPLLIHDGTDTVAWTFSEPVGTKWVADDTAQYYADAKAMTFDNGSVGAIMQVINNLGPGNNIDMTGNYVATTMWIYVGNDWVIGDSFSLYAHVDGVLVGNKVYLEDYFDISQYNVWQYIDIPLADLGIASSSIDAFRIENESRTGPQSPQLWMDEWYLQESGTALEYLVKPDTGTWLHINTIQTNLVDAYSADNADSTMPHLSYNKILDVTPVAGYIRRRYAGGESTPIEERRFTSLLDLLSCPYSTLTNYVSDGTNTLITVTMEYPKEDAPILKAEDLDKIVFTIEDDFSALLFFRISIHGHVEQR